MSGALRVSAWLPSGEAALKSFEAHASKLTRVYPLWYKLGDEGLASRRLDSDAASRARVIAAAQQHGVQIIPESSSFADEGRVMRIQKDARAMAYHRRCLEALVTEDQAQGFRTDYPAEGGLQLSAVKFLGNDSEAPAPLAPLEAIKTGLILALKRESASQVELGLPALGMVWNKTKAVALDYSSWSSLVKLYGPAKRDASSGEQSLLYQGRQAWFVDSVAVLGKLLIARELGLDQVAFWALGTEDPRLWDMLEDFPVPFAMEQHGL